MSDFPRRPNGKIMSLKGVSEPAVGLADIFIATMERCMAEAANHESRARSELMSKR